MPACGERFLRTDIMKKTAFVYVIVFLTLVCGAARAQKTVTGKASYYSDQLHGHVMSNGELYDREGMTCAHLSYPFGTLLLVRNPANGKEVIVEVTDRGPFVKRYVLDLSRAAAEELGFIRRGWCVVEITPLEGDSIPMKIAGRYVVPELDVDYEDIILYPVPEWQQPDSLLQVQPEEFEIPEWLGE